MQEDEEIRRMKKIQKDTRDKGDWDYEGEDRPPKGRHSKQSKKLKTRVYDEEEE